MKKNQRGSALVWAIAVIMVLEITVAAALGVSYLYYNRTVTNHEKRQAYQTAKGIIQNVVNKINANNAEYLELIQDLEPGDAIALDIELPADKNLGSIENASIKLETQKINDYDRDILTISVTAIYDAQQRTINADLQQGKISGINTWQLLKYYEVEYQQLDSINIRNAKRYKLIADSTTKIWLKYPNNKDEEIRRKEWFAMLASDYPSEFANYKLWYDTLADGRIWGSNDDFRKFIYYSNNPATNTLFEKDAAKNQDLVLELNKHTKGKDDQYIQAYFAKRDYPDSTLIIIFANYSKVATSQWDSVYLVYNPDDGHWYYIGNTIIRNGDIILYDDSPDGQKEAAKWNMDYNGKVNNGLMMTLFDGHASKTPGMLLEGNEPIDRWNRFKIKAFTPENRID